MPTTLRYPPRPGAPTLAYQLIVDTSEASPRVVETPTIGYPFELSQLTISGNLDTTAVVVFGLFLVTTPYTGGEARSGIPLQQVQGDLIPSERRNMVWPACGTLTLRPRIRVPQAGYRIRCVQDVNTTLSSLRLLILLTPLD